MLNELTSISWYITISWDFKVFAINKLRFQFGHQYISIYYEQVDFSEWVCVRDGFDTTYRNWTCHGETFVPFRTSTSTDVENSQCDFGDDMVGMLNDALGNSDINIHKDNAQQSTFRNSNSSGADAETKRFIKLLGDAETSLFPGCKKHTKLSFIARLLHLKCYVAGRTIQLTCYLNY